MARPDRLGPAKEAAQIAAVIGREFSYTLLQAVSGLVDEPLQTALVQLADAELVYVRGLPPEATYTFKHALLQDTAYESLLKSRRRELHRAVAGALTGRFASLAEAQPEVVAQHWEVAGDAERAVGAWQHAGDQAKERSAIVEAERHYRRALAALPDTPARDPQELALQIALDLVVSVTHGYAWAQVEPMKKRQRELGARAVDTRHVVLSLILAWALPIARGQPRAALALAEQALVAAHTDDSTFALSWAHCMVAQSKFELGDFAAAEEHAAAALHSSHGNDRRAADAIGPLGSGGGRVTRNGCRKGELERIPPRFHSLIGRAVLARFWPECVTRSSWRPKL